ncbi:MAG: PTS mannose/fructose/sorbose family IIA subunit [Tepidanaerobacter acetatoxydans]|uniref:PTS sugar transporter subunit IIA n=1 Tax=Tepidanaerobacter TaxID=499228 RepID=UPI000A4C161A|nr:MULTISPECIES: hypothetical protein [Tepidanaerobacter]NLU10837.1 PTS mannose/fructose/sorbose family IIA subunit [Tepidanaerobacter acetatoxydans]
MMFNNKIIVATHGNLAESLVETSQMIMGKADNVYVLGLQPGMDIDQYRKDLVDEILREPECDVLIMLDLIAGTPFNSIISTLDKSNVSLVTGVNLPMLIEVLSQKDVMSVEELCAQAKKVGTFGIQTKEDILKRHREVM